MSDVWSIAASGSKILTVRALQLLHAGDDNDARSAAAKTSAAVSARGNC
jgi:hypothetical protein